MAAGKRQLICDAFKARMQTILVANGFETNVGQKVFEWKTAAFTDAELPGLTFRDKKTKTEQRVGNIHHHEMTMEVAAMAADGHATPATMRKLAADIIKAVGADRKFGGLVFNSDPGEDELRIEQEGKTVGAIKLSFVLHYRTENFNPYQ